MKLLTEELREKINDAIENGWVLNPADTNHPARFSSVKAADNILSVIEAEHKETLKAIGELLGDKCLIVDPVTHEPEGYWIDLADGNKLKRGEMPEEEK